MKLIKCTYLLHNDINFFAIERLDINELRQTFFTYKRASKTSGLELFYRIATLKFMQEFTGKYYAMGIGFLKNLQAVRRQW